MSDVGERPYQIQEIDCGEHLIKFEPPRYYINGKELDCDKAFDWFQAAINEKATRELLDENGLVRCGCGGNLKADESEFGGFYAFCDECGCRSGGAFDTAEQALMALYKAMGR